MNSKKQRLNNIFNLFCMILVITQISSVSGLNFDCKEYFSNALNCEEKMTSFDRQLISNVIGDSPILLKNKLEWASKASSRFFKCEKEAVQMCLNLSIDTDSIYMASSDCRDKISSNDTKNIFQLQQAIFTRQISSEQEFIQKINTLQTNNQSTYFTCFVKNIAFQLKSKSNQNSYQY